MSGAVITAFEGYENLVLKQTRLQLLLTNIRVATIENPTLYNFFLQEDSYCCCRVYCNRHYNFRMDMHAGNGADGEKLAQFTRPCALPMHPCKLMCRQRIEVSNPANKGIGSVEETTWCCLPTFHTKDSSGKVEFNLHNPVCFGCLPNICADSICCKAPFYIYRTDNDKEFVGKIVSHMTTGFGLQVEVIYPRDCTPDQKVRLFAAALLLNELYFKPRVPTNPFMILSSV